MAYRAGFCLMFLAASPWATLTQGCISLSVKTNETSEGFDGPGRRPDVPPAISARISKQQTMVGLDRMDLEQIGSLSALLIDRGVTRRRQLSENPGLPWFRAIGTHESTST